MTLIAAIAENGKVFMIADTLGSNSSTKHTVKTRKIVQKGDMLIGTSGSFKAVNIIDMEFKPLPREEGLSDSEYVYRNVKEITRLVDASGFASTSQGTQETKLLECSSLIGFKGKVYKFQHNGSMLELADDFAAVGSGSYHAEASLYSTRNSKLKAEERLLKALECASYFVMSVNNEAQLEVV